MANKSTLMLLALLASGSISTVQAQGYKPGYVVRPAGDTLRGFLQSRGALRNSLQCSFRPAPDAPVVEYTPADLRAYALTNGPRYESQLIPPVYMTDAEPGRQDLSVRPYFLEVLVSGRASLYTRRDANDETRYYLRMAAAPAAAPVQELEKRLVHRAVYVRDQDQSQAIYRKTLSVAFQDCLAIQPLLPTLDFSSGSLVNAVQRYNGYFEAPAAAKLAPASRRIKIIGGLVAGAANTEMRFEGEISLQKGTFKNTFSPTGGLFVTALLSPLNDRLNLRLEVLFERLKYSNSYVARGFSSVDLSEQATFELRSLRFPLQARYHFNAGPVRPFLLAGLSGSYLLSSTRELRSEYTVGGTQVVMNKQAVSDIYIRSYEVGIFGGAGLALPGIKGHALGLEVRGERSSGYVTSGSFAAPIFRYSGLLSFNLF
ncbi:outer membrane beta-barrel protein [Hymenobacter antarcticus]|uniref:Outer membrane protein beta-barrel domain-containing protein n=1 Tax=Hymenobacter antarcticus TaxID=486270 RepID=A0ABP7R1C9_9BACT